MKTTEKLAQALSEAGAPTAMVEAAKIGRYDDFLSDHVTPTLDLIRDCTRYGLSDLAVRVMNGEFDATKEEADAWWNREGARIVNLL